MNELLQKFVDLEMRIANEKGPFDLFALFSSDEEPENKWDLVVSATWIGEDNKPALNYLSNQLSNILNTQELLSISKIVILDVYDPRVKQIQKIFNVEHGLIGPNEFRTFAIKIDKAYVITSKPQVDERLTDLVWDIITQLWRSGRRQIKSEEILNRLEVRGERVPDYAIDRILTYLLKANCIRGVQFISSEPIRRHGHMVITSVNLDCSIRASLTLAI
jgi:hypothetical protein